MNARVIQIIALAGGVAAATVCGRLLPPILEQNEAAGLRYTDDPIDGAPPWVALGTAIGALRGVIVDILWIRTETMKSKGLFYEAMADADLITKLQPRFAQVWAFQGHNMAYNISVACHTREERWNWVNNGINLVRNKGLRHNPNDLELHKELAFWFAHKIDGYSDDAHLFYKRAFCNEWYEVLGEPPVEHDACIAWIREIADAPGTLDEAEKRSPGVKALVARITKAMSDFDASQKYEASRRFLRSYTLWRTIHDQSEAARLRGITAEVEKSPAFIAFTEVAADPAAADAWRTLLTYTRKRVLLDDYNMDPQLMYEFTRDLGPIDWRIAQAHALYWSRKGSLMGESRLANDDDIYKIVNNDRLFMQALQDLARYGRVSFDPFSMELPSRYPEPRWIDTIEREFYRVYYKHINTRGGGGDTFATAFMPNFMKSAVREAYRAGETERAQRLLDLLDELFGPGTTTNNPDYRQPLDVFVWQVTKGQIELQPHIGPSETVASMYNGFRLGVGRNDESHYKEAIAYCEQIIDLFKNNENWDFVTKFEDARMAGLIQDLPTIKREAFARLMTDPMVSMQEKATIWAQVDKYEPWLRAEVYDDLAPHLAMQFQEHELSAERAFNEVFPQPPNLEAYRAQLLERRIREEEARRAAEERAPIATKDEVIGGTPPE